MKFCTNCGQKIKDGLSFCPHCGKQLHSQKENHNFDQSPNQQNSRTEYQRKQKKSRWRLKLLLWLLACMFMTLGTICTLLYFEIVDIPALREIMAEIGIVQHSKSDEDTVKDSHEHIWMDATCTSLRTCGECGETEGVALGHQWRDATCTDPVTCDVCGAIDGDPLGHIWVEATCTDPKRCENCTQIEGDALGHSWADATYQQAKTCTRCKRTDGRSLAYPLTYCKSVEDSNEPNSNTDVQTGDFNDTFGFHHSNALQFWVAEKTNWADTEYIIYETDLGYELLEFTISAGVKSDPNGKTKILIYADDVLVYESVWIGNDTDSVRDTLEISGVNALKVVCTTDSPVFCYCIFDSDLYVQAQ